jgi:hypothetical protein
MFKLWATLIVFYSKRDQLFNLEPFFADRSHCKKHITSVHEGMKPFECNVCGAIFVINANLKVHNASVHGEKKPFQCTICAFLFQKLNI